MEITKSKIIKLFDVWEKASPYIKICLLVLFVIFTSVMSKSFLDAKRIEMFEGVEITIVETAVPLVISYVGMIVGLAFIETILILASIIEFLYDAKFDIKFRYIKDYIFFAVTSFTPCVFIISLFYFIRF